MSIRYPFTAIIGQEELKKALILNLVNEKIGGLLIDGEKGVAKSTIVRSLDCLSDKAIIEMPINISEDKLIGSINIEKTIENGFHVFEEGLLHKAHKNILYVDEVNLLPDNIVDSLLGVSASKTNIVEREGISYSHESDFILIGTMNRENGDLRAGFIDRFPLYVYVKSIEDPMARVELLKRILSFEKDKNSFKKVYSQYDLELYNHINKARDFIKKVNIPDYILIEIAKLSVENNVKGHRADIIMQETIKALAALNFREEVNSDDIYEAAKFVYPHRSIKNNDNNQEKTNKNGEDTTRNNQNNSEKNEKKEDKSRNNNKSNNKDHKENKNKYTSGKNEVFAIGKTFKICKLAHEKDRVYRKTQGKRSKTKAENKSGQYLYSNSNVNDNDIAFDATIRAAAPYQKYREKNGMALALRESDLKGKVRQGKVSNLIVLVVDSSGSIGVNERMIEVKASILSLLKDSYIKRDKVALISFRDKYAEVVLPPTNSVERAYSLLKDMKTGGKSPLNLGIVKGYEIIKSELRKDKSIMPMLVIISDGKGNVSIDKNLKVKDELEMITKGIREDKIVNSLIIDVEENGIMSFGKAKALALTMGATYISLENLKSQEILSSINIWRKKFE